MTDERRRWWRSVGWGLFLASSWTWCIGMFLPIILLREWGWRGFWLFATVNVLGAAAVGACWTRERSEEFVRRRRGLLALFSLSTIAFQAFFVSWASWAFAAGAQGSAGSADAADAASIASISSPWIRWLVAVAIVALLTLPGSRGERGWRTLGSIATIGSLALWWSHGVEGWRLVGTGSAPPVELLMLAPAIALGFIVCPHLDLSFQRVVRAEAGPTAWVVFAIAFLPMLLFAAASYSPAGPLVTGALVVWWLLQASFTSMVHARELRWPAAVAAAVALGAFAGSPAFGGESNYLRFLGLYGAVFPGAAILLGRGYRSLAVVVYLAVAIPCFEAGFIGVGWPGGGPEAGRIAWAPLIPLGLLLGLAVAPMNNEASRRAARTAAARN